MSRRKRRTVGGLACAAVLVVVAAGCYKGNLGGPRVGDVGDSITNLAAADIEADIAPSYAYQLSGINDLTMAQQLPTIKTIDADQTGAPVDWIVELGTNDAGGTQNTNWQTDFNNEIAAVSEAPCVILVTVSPILGLNGPVGPDLNNAMNAAAAADPSKYHVLDWGNIEYSQPGWVNNYDAIHETPAGAQELANLELSALKSDCPS